MTALVTGGAGFVGKALVAALKARGGPVRIFDLNATGADDIAGSVTDPDAAARACAGVDIVYHLAGNASLWASDDSLFDAVNRGGTETMLAAAKAAGVRRFVQCSSLTTLVGRSTPVGASTADETVRLEARDMLGPYPQSKYLADAAVEQASRDGLDAVIAIPTEPLGAGDESLTPPTQMILDFLNGRTPAAIDCTLNFVPVDSLAEGLIAAGEKGVRGERYLLAGANISLPDLLALLEAKTGRAMPKTILPYWVALTAGVVETKLISALTKKPPKAPLTGVRLAGRRVSFSAEKAARDLGWRAAPMEPALEALIDWAGRAGLLRDA